MQRHVFYFYPSARTHQQEPFLLVNELTNEIAIQGCDNQDCAILYNMMKPKKLIVANWKMNVSTEKDAEGLFLSIRNVVAKLDYTKMICCPPHMYVNQVAQHVNHPNYRVGGQDAYPEESGSRTGETSVLMKFKVESEN